ncbi:hypothetical protein ACUXAV_006371 [Cupriavidus metallidurans]|jgi:hypothetical protein|uniref:Uncharacterized protein n=6 Tax=Pseudomonadota TaxID=1224 RepID=F4GGW5_ALIDK|nr:MULTISPECIES: hypothetical protein [Betaproteobacteria]MBP7965961.1 hypothetical protein [Burkholderiaceae bacterium]NMF99043.1 hypothetical protein [Aromatoleum toluolicum]QOT82323.1 hypothetical protein F7R26_040150 [Cupriavidus basilensis]TXH14823.1 MAG: hypothetical protein E6R02_00315 [Gammaproteobacteria bacterium]BCZ16609.1 hypothetical protein CTYAZ2_49340 [Comamonas testosteroni]
MDNLPMDALLTQIWQMVSPYVGGAWAALQRIFAETPTPLLIGIVVGLLLARVLRGVLIVAGLAAVVFVAVRVFGIAVPGLG